MIYCNVIKEFKYLFKFTFSDETSNETELHSEEKPKCICHTSKIFLAFCVIKENLRNKLSITYKSTTLCNYIYILNTNKWCCTLVNFN